MGSVGYGCGRTGSYVSLGVHGPRAVAILRIYVEKATSGGGAMLGLLVLRVGHVRHVVEHVAKAEGGGAHDDRQDYAATKAGAQALAQEHLVLWVQRVTTVRVIKAVASHQV